MSLFNFIHAADIHLDSPLHKLDAYEGSPKEELRHATRRAFENLVNLAIDEDVDFLLIAGDLYDGDWKDYNTGLYLVSQLRKLREAEIPVLIVAGNHDAASKITKTLRLPDGVTMFASNKAETTELKRIGVAVHGRSFSSAATTKNLAKTYPSPVPGCFNIGLLHTSLNGREGHEPYAPCSLDDLQSKGYNYWALGHAHQREVVLEDPVVLFSGNTQGRHVRECGPKGCVLVTVDDSGRPATNFKPLDVVRWGKIEIDASGADGGYGVVDLVTEKLSQLLEENGGVPLIARVEIQGSSPAHAELAGDVEHWANEFRSAAIDVLGGDACIEKVKIQTSYPPATGAVRSKEGPVGELNRCLDSLESDPTELLSLGKTLEELANKTPRELKEGEDGINPEDPHWVAEMIRHVRPMLLRRLLRKGASQ
jgi:DNA repair exonuclease SbcCD nuclease subunit